MKHQLYVGVFLTLVSLIALWATVPHAGWVLFVGIVLVLF